VDGRASQIWANKEQLNLVLEAFTEAALFKPSTSALNRPLTKREQDVVNLVAEGLTNREVAKQLGLTEHTVSNYLLRVYEKLGTSSRVELVLYQLKKQRG
jgi:two-component system nitrate/nitrite response regulator NarL